MNIEFYTTTLWLAIIWPLLLCIPALHSRLPWPRYLAIIPSIVLVAIPIDASINIPWLLFNTGLAIDGNTRWLLGAFVVIWIAAATLTLPANKKAAPAHSTTLHLLTLTGSLGALLSIDLVAFFSFSTLMSYGFYALLSQDEDKTQQRAGRLYLYFLIAADIALFEALLLVASTTTQFQYDIARQVMSEASVSPVYLYMVLLGFTLKAGIWPFYAWLTAAFNSSTRSIALLLIASPITISLLGFLRWLPARDDIYTLGIIMQLLGAAAILHSVLKIFARFILKQGLYRQGMGLFTTAWMIITFTGVFSLALGTALLNPALWQQYTYIAYPVIAVVSITLTIIILTAGEPRKDHETTDETPVIITKLINTLKNGYHVSSQLAAQLKLETNTLYNKSGSFIMNRYQVIISDKNIKLLITDWKINITLFLILGLTLTWLAI